MKRPLAVTGISLLCFSIFFLLTNSAYCFAGFCICLAFCVFTLTKYGIKYSSFAFVIAFSYVAAFFLCTYTVSCKIEPSKQLCGSYCDISGTASSFCDSDLNYCVLKNCTVNGVKTDTDITVYFGEDFTCSPEDEISTEIFIYGDDGAELWENYNSTVLIGYSAGDTKVTSPAHRSPVYYTKLCARNLGKLIDASTDKDTAAIIKALLLGDKSGLTSLFKLNLRKCGASHIFAVSGMHLSLWSAAIFLILRQRSRGKIASNAFAILFVLFYMALTGFSASVSRAGIMLITVYLGFCFRRPADALNSLGLSAIILIFINPLTALDVSFLLSFTATAAIFIIYPTAEARTFYGKSPKGLIKKHFFSVYNVILLSLCVMLFTVPILSVYFGTVSLLSPVSSLFCTLPAEFVMAVSALALCFYPVGRLSDFLFNLTSFATELIRNIINRLSDFDFAVCNIDIKIMLLLYLLTAIIVFSVYIIKKKNKLFTLSALLLCGVMIFPIGMLSNIYDSKNTYIHIFDADCEGSFAVHTSVGGECIFVCNSDSTDFYYPLSSYFQRNVIYDIDSLIFTGGLSDYSDNIKNGISELFPVLGTVPDKMDTKSFRFTANSGNSFEGITEDKMRVGLIEANGKKIVYCFYYSADFSSPNEKYSSGDLLICYPDIPKNINTADFRNIIVISNKSGEKLKLPANAVSTADTGAITIKLNATGD